MRPPGITGGIGYSQQNHSAWSITASMRPPGITGGIYFGQMTEGWTRFNEAAGYHRRNRDRQPRRRPSRRSRTRFNEAAGYHRRNRLSPSSMAALACQLQ